ncbi:MAG TPA: transglycosylase SLT domain-containing protein [Acidisarcina sp.]|nr:transglycosylase SLT domain-containing protein [Acidisarcina sp.]
MAVSNLSIAASCIALVLLTGCDPQPATSPAGKSPQATAPTLPRQNVQLTQSPQLTPTPATTPAPANRSQQQLIDQVEQAYASGVSNYRNGRLSEAKRDFDRAVDMMLASGIDLKSDPQLSDEFEHIVDAVNTLEMEALKQGNGFAPKVEPAPVDIANDVTFPVDPNLKAQAIAELKTTQSDLPLVINDYVASQISFFSTKGHGTLMRSLQRAGRYKPMIQKILAEEGVPQDLIYQAVAESGFQPQVVNGRSGAAGMWQFMPYGTYGLTRNGWYDERFDPEKSTRAYARYMKQIYNQLGDWYLAMAGYDWGPGNVQRAVQRTGYADFWELYRRNALPQETKNYVPVILAAAIMAKNPGQYGLEGVALDSATDPDTVTTNSSIDLRLVADVTEVPVQEIVALNPSLLRMSTPPDTSFDLHLPAGKKDLFEKRIAEIPEDKRRSWRYHKLAPGESLDEVARNFHVSASDIAFVNQLPSGEDLSQTDALVIPVAPAVSTYSSARATTYVVRRGDTLVSVADRFGVSIDQLRRWNHLKTARVSSGRRLFVAEPAHVVRTSSHTRGSRVQAASGSSSRTHSSSHSRSLAKHSSSGHSAAAHSASASKKTSAKASTAVAKHSSASKSSSSTNSKRKKRH